MQFLNLITSLCLLVVSATVAAAFTGEPFEVTDLTFDRNSTDVSVSFTIYDPDPLTNVTAECAGTWKYRSNGYPKDSYASCSNSTFGWNMARFNGYQRFNLGLQHRFNDPAIGGNVITYGTAVVNRTNFACENGGETVSCEQKPGAILGPITRTSAK